MGLMDFIKGELLEVIEWTDDSRDTLSYRYPDEDKAIKNGAQLIVRESQTVQMERIPAARCNQANEASRRTLQRAGMFPCARIIRGRIADDSSKERDV